MKIPSYKVIGVRVSAATMADLHEAIGSAIKSRQRFMMVSQNLHSVYIQRKNESLQRMQQLADCVRIDGMPLVWFSKLAGLPVGREHRTGWMDWIDPFMQQAQQHGWRIFYVGSKEEVKEKAFSELRERYPSLSIDGVNGYFKFSPDSGKSTEITGAANSSGADILLVGMGMPRQEEWILRNLEDIQQPVVLTCGACMDYVAGVQSIPPRWMGRIGLEWLHRLFADPKRMWFRYIIEPWYAVGQYLIRALGFRKD